MSDINSLDDMEIIYFSSEVAPFSKRGGMGDVVGNLPVELSKKGRDVTLITPYYSVIETDKTIDFNDKVVAKNALKEKMSEFKDV